MAAIASSDVTDVASWRENRMGHPAYYHRIVDILLSGNGGTTLDMPAATLGYKIIRAAMSINYIVTAGSALKCVPVVTEASGVGILTVNLADATDATRSAPANVVSAGTLRVYLIGLENN